jgi:hypothetical protein
MRRAFARLRRRSLSVAILLLLFPREGSAQSRERLTAAFPEGIKPGEELLYVAPQLPRTAFRFLLPPKLSTLEIGEGFLAALQRENNVALLESSQLYAASLKRAHALNPSRSDLTVPLGSVLIPVAPLAVRTPGAETVLRFFSWDSIESRGRWSPALVELASEPSILEQLKPSSQGFLIRHNASQPLPPNAVSVFQMWTASWDDSSSEASSTVFASEPIQREALRYGLQLAHRSGRHIVLWVLDDAWPSNSDAANAVAELNDLLRETGGNSTPDIPKPSCADTPHSHAASVRRSLAQLAALDTAGIIRIRMLPILIPPCARVAYQQLLKTYNALVEPPETRPDVLQLQIDGILENQRAASSEESSVAFALELPYALLQLEQLRAKRTNSYFVVNASWVLKGTPRYMPPAFDRGVFVAAAGNADKPVWGPGGEFLFAGLARRQTGVVAAMNLREDGKRYCSTNHMPDSFAARDKYVVGLEGDLDHRCGGTSFSAPRAAWLFALWLAATPSSGKQNCIQRLFKEILARRLDSDRDGPVRLTPAALLSGLPIHACPE